MILCVTDALSELHKIILNQKFSAEHLLRSMDEVCGHIYSSLPPRKVHKVYSDKYLVEVCFTKKEYMCASEALAFSQISLLMGVKYLKKFLYELQGRYILNGDEAIVDASKLLYNYLHDFRPLIEYVMQAQAPGYVFFNGAKSSETRTNDLYWLSNMLSYQASTSRVNPLAGAYHECCVASVFVLRQAMEAKFERIVGVMLLDRHFNAPKYWHGFHYEFIMHYSDGFQFHGFELGVLRSIYDWCSMIVHRATIPLSWLIPMAHDYCEGLFGQGLEGDNGYCSIYGAVRVESVEKMQQDYIEYFFDNYHNGIYCVDLVAPEVVEKNKFEIC